MPLLIPITDCDEPSFLEIAGVKRGMRRTRLRNAWPDIKKRYEHFEKNSATLENIQAANFTTIRKNDCKHCYKVETKPLSNLIRRVLNIVPSSKSTMCQYCLIGEIDTVDHYAPKDLFPEFAVFPRNLVASCSLCNRLKSTKWLKNGVREIFSLYFEEFPSDQFLFVNIDFPSGNRAKVSFELRRPVTIKKAIFSRIERQFEILNLIERYNTSGAEFVSSQLISTSALPANKKTMASKFLTKVADGVEDKFGRNHMQRLICLNLASNGDFMRIAGMK